MLYCPLLGTMRTLNTINPRFAPCVQGDCAWWHVYEDEHKKIHTACAIFHIAQIAQRIMEGKL